MKRLAETKEHNQSGVASVPFRHVRFLIFVRWFPSTKPSAITKVYVCVHLII